MRKKQFILLLLCGALLFSFSANAMQTVEFHMGNLQGTIDMPDDYLLLTRETKKQDDALVYLGISLEEVQDVLEENNIYIMAFPKGEEQIEYGITLWGEAGSAFGEISDFSEISSEEQLEYLETICTARESQGARVQHVDWIDFPTGPALYIVYEESDGTWSEEIHTVICGQTLRLDQYSDAWGHYQNDALMDMMFTLSLGPFGEGGEEADHSDEEKPFYTKFLSAGGMFLLLSILSLGKGKKKKSRTKRKEQIEKSIIYTEKTALKKERAKTSQTETTNWGEAAHSEKYYQKRQLEQMEELYKSGFLTKEEYIERKSKWN